MTEVSKRTISLPLEHSNFIDGKIASGYYASASEVVRDGLRALQERDAAIERWLNGPVAETYDAMMKSPKQAVSVDKAFATLRKRRKSL